LYSTTNLDCNDESFFNHNIKLTEEQKYLCEGNITFKECAQSLKLMTNGKSPGSDGYTVDFYKFFWEDIGPLLYRSLYLAYESGSFTDFQYQGVIIFKCYITFTQVFLFFCEFNIMTKKGLIITI
jgi:hypothetical protein